MEKYFIFRFYISNHQGYRRFMDGKIKQTDFCKDLKTELTDKKTTGLTDRKTTGLTDR